MPTTRCTKTEDHCSICGTELTPEQADTAEGYSPCCNDTVVGFTATSAEAHELCTHEHA